MAVSETVISAYCRIYSVPQLTEALAQALQDRASGVLVTQVNFQDGGGSGQAISGDPNEIIEILELALQRMELPEGQTASRAPLTSAMNFSTRRFET